jgi:hypothetical protein
MRKDFPPFDQLANIFLDESKAIFWLIENGAVDKIEVRPTCGEELRLDGRFYHCRSRSFRKICSLFVGSFFSYSKLECRKILQIGYYWLGGSGRHEIVRFTGCAHKTATAYIEYYRQLVISSLDDEDDMVGGEGIIVEIDESKFGKRKYHRGLLCRRRPGCPTAEL